MMFRDMKKMRVCWVLILLPLCLVKPKGLFADKEQMILDVKDAWVRLMPPTVSMTAGFMTIHNPTDTVMVIVGAESQAAKVIEMHNMTHENEVMKMFPVDQIEVPPHSTVFLEPSALHLMLMDLQAPLHAGESFLMNLILADERRVPVVAEVRSESVTQNGVSHQHHDLMKGSHHDH